MDKAAIEAFERIWRNEAIGGDYQTVRHALEKLTQKEALKYGGYKYSSLKKYKEIIQTACGFMKQAQQELPDGANKKRFSNFIKTYSRYPE